MSAKIVIAGDLCLQDRTAKMSFDKLCITHKDVKRITSEADYSIVNLECAIVENNIPHIKKTGVALCNFTKTLDLIKYMGFDAVTLANNHFADYGERGVIYSFQQLKERNIDFVGAGINLQEAKYVLYKNVKGTIIAIINACEHEFTVAKKDKAGCNPLNPISLYYDIDEARKKSDYVIVIIHGGHEHYQLPTIRMQDTYRFFVEAGANVVVNHHQHCYSGYEMYKDCPIFYGLGNFSFDENGLRGESWNEGFLVLLTLSDKIGFELIPYVQNDKNAGVSFLKDEDIVKFMDNIRQFNEIISDSERLDTYLSDMATGRKEEYLKPLMPSRSGFLSKLAERHLLPKKWADKLLPDYMTEERKLFLKSYFQCESHQEIMNRLLEL